MLDIQVKDQNHTYLRRSYASGKFSYVTFWISVKSIVMSEVWVPAYAI